MMFFLHTERILKLKTRRVTRLAVRFCFCLSQKVFDFPSTTWPVKLATKEFSAIVEGCGLNEYI